jgi:hypothetical protein
LTDDSLACFTSHCPLLQTLEIDCCTGLQQPAISAPNLLLLEIMVYDGLEVLTIDCPEIKTIRLPMIDDLRVNGVLFHEISFAVVGLKMHQGRNVIGLELDSREDYTFSPQRFLEIVGSFKALKKLETHISALLERGNEMVVPLISLLQRLPHLEILITTGMSLLVRNSFIGLLFL